MSKEWLKNIKINQELKNKIYYDEKNDLWVISWNAIEQALTELERLKKFKETFDNYELSKRQDFIAFENWLECERELAVIKCDVKRFMELLEEQDTEEHDEFSLLYNKLLEVCQEEEE